MGKSFIIVMLIVAGCASDHKASLKLYVYDCGRLNYDSIESLGISDDETDVRDLIVSCYIIEHDKGRLLWEGGLPSSLAQVNGWQEMDGGWRMRLDKPLVDQIAELNLSMSDFDYVSFSHFHFDHIGVANEVEGATLIIQKAEYEGAFADTVTVPGFTPELYDNLRESEKIIIEGDYDVFGDGRVKLISAPGHTLGHQVLFLDLIETGPVILSGDLYVFQKGREERWVLPFNADSIQTVSSMNRIEALIKETGSDLWIGHELAKFDSLKKPPEYHN
ncbi:MAG: N-acyl homoserine lactonase family protein [Bacteroidota bacterium]